MDTTNRGELSEPDLLRAVRLLPGGDTVSPEAVTDLFNMLDNNKDNFVDFCEFCDIASAVDDMAGSPAASKLLESLQASHVEMDSEERLFLQQQFGEYTEGTGKTFSDLTPKELLNLVLLGKPQPSRENLDDLEGSYSSDFSQESKGENDMNVMHTDSTELENESVPGADLLWVGPSAAVR